MSLMQLARVAAAEAQTISNSTTPSRSPTPPSPATSADEQLTTKRTMHSPLPSVRALFPTLLASPRAGPTAPASHSQFAAQSPGLTQVPNRPWHDPGQPSTSTASAAALASTRTPLQYAPNSYPHQRRERDEYRRPSPPQQHQHQHQHQPSASSSSSCCCHCSHSHSSPHQPTSVPTFTPAPAAAPSGPTYTVLAPSPSGLAPVQTDASRPIGIVRVGRDGRVSGSHASSSPSADEREQQQQQQRFHPYSSGSGSPPRHQMMMNAQYSGHAPHQPAERDRYPYEAGSASVAQHIRQHQGYPQQLQQPQATFAQYMSAPTSSGNGGKKHVCEVCGAGFSRPSELKTHSHKHTGERPFTCGLCARNFSTSSNLGRHVRSIHPREREQAMRLARGPGGVSVLRDPTTTASIKEEQLGLLSPPESVSGSPLAAAARGFSSPTSSVSGLPTTQASRGAGGGALRLEIPVVMNKGHASTGSVSSMASSEMGSAGGIVSPEDVPMSAVEA